MDTKTQIQDLFNITSQFSTTRNSLNKLFNQQMSEFFDYIGFSFRGVIENPNIMHIIAEAWLLTLFEGISTSVVERYSDLLGLILEYDVPLNEYIKNIQILTKIFNIRESVLTNDSNVYEVFLINLNEAKIEILDQAPFEELDSKRTFEDLMLEIIRTGVNYSINEFNSSELNKKNLKMFKSYTSEITIENYITSATTKEEEVDVISQPGKEKLRVMMEKYFDFLKTDVESFIKEIEFINKNWASLMFRLQILFSPRNLKKLIGKYVDKVAIKIEEKIPAFPLTTILNMTTCAMDVSQTALTKTLPEMKQWITSSLEQSLPLQMAKPFYTNLIRMTSTLASIPRVVIYDTMYKPLKNISIQVYDTIVIVSVKGYENAMLILRRILNMPYNVLNSMWEFVTGALIVVDAKGENVHISISKKLFLIDPQMTINLISQVVDTVKSVNQLPENALAYTREKYITSKDYMISNYQKFLSVETLKNN